MGLIAGRYSGLRVGKCLCCRAMIQSATKPVAVPVLDRQMNEEIEQGAEILSAILQIEYEQAGGRWSIR